MEQLKMYWLPGTPIRDDPLPEGYSVSRFTKDEDRLAWCECCKNGLIPDDAGIEAFYHDIESRPDINIYEDVFFLDYQGEHVGTVTAFIHKDSNIGDMHMVGLKPEFRGRGLAKYFCIIIRQIVSLNLFFMHVVAKPIVNSSKGNTYLDTCIGNLSGKINLTAVKFSR